MKDIRMIATDIDGTLVQRDGRILPETLEALRAAASRGVVLALASGRYPENAGLVWLDHRISGPVMGANGAIIEDAPMGATLYLHTMRRDAAERVRDCLNAAKADFIIFSHKCVTTCRKDLYHHSEISDGARIERLGGVAFRHGPQAVDDVIRTGASKFFVYQHPERAALIRRLSEIPGILITRSGSLNIEVMPQAVHKGRGITELARWLGIPLENVMAFGDEENDLPMLTRVGCGVAMGNAPAHVQAQCRYVTARFDENGIGEAIRRYVLDV